MPDISRTPLPYDLYVAADLFLKTGRRQDEVLARLGLSPTDWSSIAPRYFALLLGDDAFTALRSLWPDLDAEILVQALIGSRWRYSEPRPGPSDMARGIRAAVHARPRIGPFAGLGWIAVHIVDDPVAWLVFYSHDGERVFYRGEALADKSGTPLDVEASAFRHLGGRWYGDGRRIFGQGERGRNQVYWWAVDGVEAASFRVLNLRYAKDASQAWYITGKRIRTRSPAAFGVVPWWVYNWRTGKVRTESDAAHTAKDDERVYSYGAAVRGADPARFRSIGADYWTDDRRVWSNDGKVLLPEADAASFIVVSPSDPPIARSAGDATDHRAPYLRGHRIAPEAAYEDWSAFFGARADRDDWWWEQVGAERGRR